MALTKEEINEELKRTAVQKNAVSRMEPGEVLDLALAFFKERGYRSARTGRPNHIFIMGGREGKLPRVTGEVSARANVGRPGTTLVTVDAAGEQLGPAMSEFLAYLRSLRKKNLPTSQKR